jgi:hypothetical protein
MSGRGNDDSSLDHPKEKTSAHEVIVIAAVVCALLGFFIKIMFF